MKQCGVSLLRSRPLVVRIGQCASLLGLALGSLSWAAAPGPPLLDENVVSALAEEISGSQARHVVQELTLQHRMRASRGIRSAAQTLIQRLQQMSLDSELVELPSDGEIFYGTQRSRPAWDVEFAELWELQLDGATWIDHQRIASWETRPLTVAQDSASGAVEADLVDIGLGTREEDYTGKEIAGRIVLTSSQPEAVEPFAVAKHGAVGIVSYAQNQKSAWWGEDRNLVRWGHLSTFPAPETFAFMVSVNQAESWRARLRAAEPVRLRAKIEAGQHPGAYTIPMAVLPGTDPGLAGQDIVYSCHLDHPRPGANDNASGCAAILEVARSLSKLIAEGRLERPRRTIRFVWPPEIEGTIALLNARPDLVERARAVIHMDMVGGDPVRTKAIFHVTKSPSSLPTFVNDVAAAFGMWVNEQTYAYAATGMAAYPLADPEGSRQALQARMASFSIGSDHQIWTEGSFRIPAIYLNDWPDRYIHTTGDTLDSIDATKLKRAAYLGAASGYYLANLQTGEVPALLDLIEQHAVHRLADVFERSRQLDGRDALLVLEQGLAYEQQVVDSIGSFAPVPDQALGEAALFLQNLASLVRAEALGLSISEIDTSTGEEERVCHRNPEPKGPMWGFGYSYLEDRLGELEIDTPGILGHKGLWGSGSEYAYEALNLVDGRRSVAAIRDRVTTIYGPIPVELVDEYLSALEKIGVVTCSRAGLPG